jgi:hypothetical protein
VCVCVCVCMCVHTHGEAVIPIRKQQPHLRVVYEMELRGLMEACMQNK